MSANSRESTANEEQPLLTSPSHNTVAFDAHDAEDPRNWSPVRKWLMVAAIMPIDLSVSWGASGFSPAAADFARDMGVSRQVATMGLSSTFHHDY
jgi:hypothetical protein